MGSKGPRRRVVRRTKFESLEDRQMFSAEPLGGSVSHHAQGAPDFWYDRSVERDLDALLGDIEQTLASAHALTGVTQARNDYGFLGAGQTVAVIDSGIAWDHPNLGNGFGANARVVGGWDFTWENDANPYDDGPAGSHGTHVAGIVGATGNSVGDVGVAPGVDLVALRVFDDEGDGYFSWVEKALRWVHTNRNAFANPITAVNLSLGTAYNAATIPGWAMLEEEFAQLEADGIFVAVSAGNSFSTYKTPGLSYPAASPHVVPVMSVDDTGALSSFSQRHSRAIAAPGRSIRSTVPDYVGNQNGKTDDWANYSGTSMASPYVAGASVLVREAMQFVGMTGVTQDLIYDHMLSTADEIFDAATNQFYKRLNVAAALDALTPEDDFGSTAEAAFDLGTIGADGGKVSGTIGKRDDVDYFRFTASATGTVTVTVATTHYLDATWIGSGAASDDGLSYTINVVAGQSCAVGLSTTNGVGHFQIDVTSESVVPSVEILKTVVRGDGTVFSLDSEGWLRVNGSQTWGNTRDFGLAPNGTLHRLDEGGLLLRLKLDGSWQELDRDATRFIFDRAGSVYSLGSDGWINVNGQQVWENSREFCFAENGTIFWLSTAGNLHRRPVGGTWQLVDRNVTEFAVGDDGRAYALRGDHWISVDGARVWENTHDFVLTPDQTIYWHSTNGPLYLRPSGGKWQLISRDVQQFAVCQDGGVYTLSYGGQVTVNGTADWSGIVGMRTDRWGRLLLEHASGAITCVAGRFSLGVDRVTTSTAISSLEIKSSSTAASSLAQIPVAQAGIEASRAAFAEIFATPISIMGSSRGVGSTVFRTENVVAIADLMCGPSVDLYFSRVPLSSPTETGAAAATVSFDVESIVDDAHEHGATGVIGPAKIDGQLKVLDDAFAQTGTGA